MTPAPQALRPRRCIPPPGPPGLGRDSMLPSKARPGDGSAVSRIRNQDAEAAGPSGKGTPQLPRGRASGRGDGGFEGTRGEVSSTVQASSLDFPSRCPSVALARAIAWPSPCPGAHRLSSALRPWHPTAPLCTSRVAACPAMSWLLSPQQKGQHTPGLTPAHVPHAAGREGASAPIVQTGKLRLESAVGKGQRQSLDLHSVRPQCSSKSGLDCD